MPKTPKKNISSVLFDVKHPKNGKKVISQPVIFSSPSSDFKKYFKVNSRKIYIKRESGGWPRKIILSGLKVFVLGVIIIGVFSFWGIYSSKDFISAEARSIIGNSEQAIESLNNLEPQEAVLLFEQNNYKLTETQNHFKNLHLSLILNLGGFFKEISGLNQSALEISENLAVLKKKGLGLLLSNGGQGPLAIIENLKKETNNIHQTINLLRNQISFINSKMAFAEASLPALGQLNQIFTAAYLNYSPKLYQAEDFLSGLENILQSKNNVHWLVFFQNPGEIRPAGGFLGSYADLTISSGRLANIDVRDIYDPDGQLTAKTIPPWPLQTITTNWGARDANWFFDFPLSAQKTADFLEASKIYQEQNVKFSGAIALNFRILQSILEITGPIKLDGYKPELNKDNVLEEIQKEVESGADKTKGQPKNILKVLTPVLLDKLNNLTDEQKKNLLDKIKFHLENKDIMFFAKDGQLQNFFLQNGFGGEVYQLPNNFWGNYLAVVNANIAGGKSDLFVKEEINLATTLNSDGKAVNELEITRTHNGQNEKDSWWRATNQDFIKIFTAPGSSLLNLKGNSVKTVKPLVNYQKEGYQPDPDVQNQEANQQFLADFNVWQNTEFGKNVWSSWLNLPAGKTKNLDLEYETQANSSLSLASGQVYQFIFDKQSGVDASLKATIEAPPGFKWQESDNYIYDYQNDNPPSRLIINLTLVKIL